MSTAPGSSAIAIPKRKRKQHFHHHHRTLSNDEQLEAQAAESPATSESMMSSSGRSSFGGDASVREVGKSPLTNSTTAPVPMPVSPVQADKARRRGSSFLSESIARSEYTVVDVGSEDNPRLITCVKASQGFCWNQELFLPSYLDYQFESLERRQEPVEDIILTDEEAAAFLPQ